ncbi:subunit of tubulin prefoldin [Saitoella coloradoensis]
MASKPQTQTIDLSQLSLQQLSEVKKQLDEELEHLTNSFTQLRLARQKFQDCIAAIQAGIKPDNENKDILVPLTSSLYVPGKLTEPDAVIVDVGTGYYVEKTSADATKFYQEKCTFIETNMKELEKVVQQKSANVRAITGVMSEKMRMGQSALKQEETEA